MATSGRPDLLVDTSVAIALVVADHDHHDVVRQAVDGRRLGLAGHAAFETFSVLTRLPPPARLTTNAAGRIIASNFPHSRFLGATAADELLKVLPSRGIAGGSVYDALVGAVANEYGMTLYTRDRRAVSIYRALDVDLHVID